MLFLLKSILRWCVNSPPKCWSFLTESHVDFFFQPNYAEIIHIPESKASLLIGYLSIASTLSRFLFGLVLNHPRINRFYVLQVCKEMLLWRLYPVLAQKKRNLCVNWVDLISRLRVVPHFSSGRVERAKRERAWKSLHARKARRSLSLPRVAFSRLGWFSRALVKM